MADAAERAMVVRLVAAIWVQSRPPWPVTAAQRPAISRTNVA